MQHVLVLQANFLGGKYDREFTVTTKHVTTPAHDLSSLNFHMSYKLSLQIKNEFENDALAREIKEKEDRAQALLAPQYVGGGWSKSSNNNNHNNKPLDPKRFDDDPTKIDLHRKTPHHKGALSEELHDAAWREDLPQMQQMIEEDPCLLDECDSGGQNLLHLAAFWGSLVVCEQLIRLGIDCEAVNVHAQRPLDIAVQWGHVAVADVIRHAGGTSLFETKLRKVERHLMSLEDVSTIVVASFYSCCD